MSKNQQEYTPLAPWERLFAYCSAITLLALTFHQAHTQGITLRLAALMVALLIATPCALIALWDARVVAFLKRREWQQRTATRRQAAAALQAEATFSQDNVAWEYFDDHAPATRR